MEDDIDILLKRIKETVKKYKLIVICVVALISAISMYKYIKNDEDIINISNTYKDENNTNKINNTKEQKKIVVHIAGQVVNTGVYTINSESRLNDLVILAGGLTEKADSNKINLAKKLSDGEKIYISAIGEISQIHDETEQYDSNGKVNINTANKNELKNLTGIGDSTAEKIIKYREEKGDFKNIEEIQNINGIGEAKFNNIKDLICI